MKPKFSLFIILAVAASIATARAADEAPVPDIRFLAEGQKPAAATLDGFGWLVGQWKGELWGGTAEHWIMPETGGQMSGVVRLSNSDGVTMYELSAFTQTNGAVAYRNRLFSPDLVAQSPADTVYNRPLIAEEGDVLYFDGITFAKDGDDGMIVTFGAKGEDGRVAEQHVVRYRRLGSDGK